MDNQKSQINIAVVVVIAIGMPAVGLGGFFAIRSLWTSPAPVASPSEQTPKPPGNAQPQSPGGLLANLFGEIKPSANPVRSSYDPTPEPVDTTAKDFDAALESYKDSLLFIDRQFRDRVDTEWDGFLLPNSSYGKTTVKWTQVFDSNNKPIMNQDKTPDPPSSFFPGSYTLHLIDDKAIAASAIGRMTITVPITWTHLSFSKDEIGQTKRIGPLSAVLKKCQNDYYKLEVTGDMAGKEIVHFAKDATGQRLQYSSSSKSFNTISAQAKGQVSRVELFVCQGQHTAQADVVARVEPKIENRYRKIEPTVAHPRYVRTGIKWNFAAMTEKELTKRVEILSLRCDAMVGYNDPELRVCLPPVANSWFATISFGNEDACKRIPCDSSGRPVPCDVEYGLFGDSEGGIGKEIRFRSTEYPAKDSKQVSFHRARGEVRIRYPAEIRRVVLTLDNPRSGAIRADFNGSKVTVQGWKWPGRSFPKPDYSPIRVYDQTGNRLKELGFKDDRYWGKPVRVEIIDVTKWIDVTIPYDLPPAPLLPGFGSGK